RITIAPYKTGHGKCFGFDFLNIYNFCCENAGLGAQQCQDIQLKRRKIATRDIQKRIELIQDFDMPTVSHCIQVSPDGQYIYVAGTYKPRVRCYDVHQLSMKFERGLDSDVLQFQFLSEDYTKIAFLQCDRYIEFHSQYGRYYRTRIPKYGRDLAYHSASCDLYVASVSPEVYRINLEQGRFLNPLTTSGKEVKCCEFNDQHHLLACGTSEGHVECFDPRVPAITALKFRNGLELGVGTSTGHYELPIKRIMFHDAMDLVLSMDSKILKLWDRNNGKAYTAIEPGVNLNDMCMVPGSGLVFMANEAQKVLSYYLPSLGTAPRWCSFLDNLTEELEESAGTTVYDDYKFVTRRELEDLGLAHLIGSNLLRAYMHGFFLDMRLYHKAKSIAEPFAFDQYRKQKIREKIDAERANRVTVKKLPKVNKELAEKLIDVEDEIVAKKTEKRAGMTLLKDSRFSDMFSNPDFQIEKESEEYKLLNPVVAKLDRARKTKQAKLDQQFQEMQERKSDRATGSKPRFYEIKEGQEYGKSSNEKKVNKEKKMSLAERLEQSGDTGKKEIRKESEQKVHMAERKKVRRSAGAITKGIKERPKFWMGQRVK
ncbi:NOL10-like protein, partial [Mya arenaria]